jgi:hypothetical protein
MGGNVLSGNFISRKILFVFIAVLFLSGSAAAPRCAAQQKKMPQTAGVDNSKMGPYRALAQLAFAASQKGDNATAATLAKILERVWDKSEDFGGDAALAKTNRTLFDDVDKSMDRFISMLLNHATAPPEPAAVKAAFTEYMGKLQLAD